MEDDEGATPLDLLAGTAPLEAGSPAGSMDSGSWLIQHADWSVLKLLGNCLEVT